MTEPAERKRCCMESAQLEITFGINVNKKLHNNLTPSKDTLEMQNRSDNDILVYFKTQAVDDDLLEKMRLRIKCGEEKVYDGDLVSAELNEYKALTEVKAGSDGRFDFEVMLPEDSGNYYSVLEDKVVWKFRVEEADKGRGVMTGDGTDIIIIIVLAALSAGGIIYSLTTLKRVKRK